MKKINALLVGILVMVLAACSNSPAPTAQLESRAVGWQRQGSILATNFYDTRLAAQGSEQVVVYLQNDFVSSLKIFAKRWTGSSWQNLGTTVKTIPYTSGVDAIDSLTVRFNSANQPLVAWLEKTATSTQVVSKRWTGTQWVNAARPTPLPRSAGYIPELSLNSRGLPTVIWVQVLSENESRYRTGIKLWNGSAWQSLPGVYTFNLFELEMKLTIDSKDRVVVATQKRTGTDFPYQFPITVKRWNGSSWQSLGLANPGQTDKGGLSLLSVDRLDNPMICFGELLDDGDVYVSRRTSTGWKVLDEVSSASGVTVRQRERRFYSLTTTLTNEPLVSWLTDIQEFENRFFIARWSGGTNPKWQLLSNNQFNFKSGSVTVNSKNQPIVAAFNQQGLSVLRWSE